MQVKIWFQNRRMKWRNSKERELLSSGGSRDATLPSKDNPNPDLSDVSNNEEDAGDDVMESPSAILDMSKSSAEHPSMGMPVFSTNETEGQLVNSEALDCSTDRSRMDSPPSVSPNQPLPPPPAHLVYHDAARHLASAATSCPPPQPYDAESSSDEEEEEEIFVS